LTSYFRAASLDRIKRVIRYATSGRFDYYRYALWVRWKGLDFGPVPLAKLGLSYARSEHHSASGGVFLADVLQRIEIPPGSRVVDLGCGKGSAACTLAKFPFEEVAGVELSAPLVRIAEANARKLRLTNLSFYVSDAAEFEDLDRFTHIYMFNPFPASVMAEVTKNLADSLRRTPRKLTVIYFFPVCHDVIMNCGLFRKEMEIDVNFSHSYSIYVHDDERSSLQAVAS
jgi:SAM-dependent methyltransferase